MPPTPRSEGVDAWDRDPALAWIACLPLYRRAGRDVLLLVAEEPVRDVLLALARATGFDAYACATPHDVIDTLVQVGDRVACAIVSAGATWGSGLREFLADEYPGIHRIAVA